MKQQHKNDNETSFENWVASLGKVGYLPASGTWGSLCAIPFAVILSHHLLTLWIFVAGSFLLGLWTIPYLIQNQKNQDPSYVVIDEFMGQLLVFACLPGLNHPLFYLFGFLFFRLFDILKPWPVSFFDQKVHGAWGIMMDDFMAGLYAVLALIGLQVLNF